MKDGKPEVLIIAERMHPYELISAILPTKVVMRRFGKKKDEQTPVNALDEEKLTQRQIESLKIPAQITENLISAIKNFKAQRILWEFPKNPATERACKKLAPNRNLGNLQTTLLKIFNAQRGPMVKEFNAICKRYGAPAVNPQPMAMQSIKELSFILGGAEVYEIKFFDDDDVLKKDVLYEMAYRYLESIPFTPEGDLIKIGLEWQKWREKREAAMVKNIKKFLIDKTVIICGKQHLPAIAKGLGEAAHISYLELGI